MDSNFTFKDQDIARSISYMRGCRVIEAEEFIEAFKNIVESLLLKGGKVNLDGMFSLQVFDQRNGRYRLKMKISDTLRKKIRENASEVAYEKRRVNERRSKSGFLQDR